MGRVRAGRERHSERKFSATVCPFSTQQKTVVTSATRMRSVANPRSVRQACQAAPRQIAPRQVLFQVQRSSGKGNRLEGRDQG